MGKGNGFLAGLAVGKFASGPTNRDIERSQANTMAANVAGSSLAQAVVSMSEVANSWQDNTYITKTKLKARIDTEDQLLAQLEEAKANHTPVERIPLADIKSFDEQYLLNLIKAKQDQTLIKETYGEDGLPPEVKERNRAAIDEITQELEEKGIHVPS